MYYSRRTTTLMLNTFSETFIASCGDDVKVWDTSNLKKTHSHRFHDTKVGNICWNQDNNVSFFLTAIKTNIFIFIY